MSYAKLVSVKGSNLKRSVRSFILLQDRIDDNYTVKDFYIRKQREPWIVSLLILDCENHLDNNNQRSGIISRFKY